MANGVEGLRRGSRYAFWGTLNSTNNTVNTVTVNANDVSSAVQSGRGTNMFCFFINADKASAFTLQVAHVGDFSGQGVIPDPDDTTKVWYDLWYLGNSGTGNSTPVTLTFTGAGTLATIIPDFEPNWVRLKCTSGTTVAVYAGFEAWGD